MYSSGEPLVDVIRLVGQDHRAPGAVVAQGLPGGPGQVILAAVQNLVQAAGIGAVSEEEDDDR